MRLLVCPRCGAPLPTPTPGGALVTCLFCGASTSLSTGTATAAPSGDEHPSGLPASARAAFCQALAAELTNGVEPRDALVRAARAHLGKLGESDAMARVALALAAEFEKESGALITREAMAMSRLAEGYFGVVETLRTSERAELNLPFLTATSDGPKHFVRTLTAASIAELASHEPTDAPAPKKKRGFWPFS